jgi:hypothetical protein
MSGATIATLAYVVLIIISLINQKRKPRVQWWETWTRIRGSK